jgi:hypothetical protein
VSYFDQRDLHTCSQSDSRCKNRLRRTSREWLCIQPGSIFPRLFLQADIHGQNALKRRKDEVVLTCCAGAGVADTRKNGLSRRRGGQSRGGDEEADEEAEAVEHVDRTAVDRATLNEGIEESMVGPERQAILLYRRRRLNQAIFD